MQEIINKICEYYKVDPSSIAKKRYGSLPTLSYSGVLSRLLLNNTKSIEDAFPEMGRTTISKMLNTCFPGKTNSAQLWPTYLLSLVNKRKCCSCSSIKELSEFYYLEKSKEYRCKECKLAQGKAYYLDNRDEVLRRTSSYNLENAEKIKIYKKEYQKLNKEKIKEWAKEYHLNHQAERKQYSLRRYLRLTQATPSWANLSIMNLIYASKKDGEHTDHEVPLQSSVVCGLHCEHNLRNIPASENLSKGNKFDPETYIHKLPENFKI